MKIYWSYKSIPELQELPKKEAIAIFIKCRKKTMAENKKAVWQSMFISILTATLVMWLCIWVADLLFPGLAHWQGRMPWLFAITGGIGGFFGTIPQTHDLTKASLPHIRAAVAKRNLPRDDSDERA